MANLVLILDKNNFPILSGFPVTQVNRALQRLLRERGLENTAENLRQAALEMEDDLQNTRPWPA